MMLDSQSVVRQGSLFNGPISFAQVTDFPSSERLISIVSFRLPNVFHCKGAARILLFASLSAAYTNVDEPVY